MFDPIAIPGVPPRGAVQDARDLGHPGICSLPGLDNQKEMLPRSMGPWGRLAESLQRVPGAPACGRPVDAAQPGGLNHSG